MKPEPFTKTIGRVLRLLALGLFGFVGSPLSAEPLIVDHTAVALYDQIPADVLAKVRGMWLNIAGESHSTAYGRGCELLEAADSRFSANETDSGTMEMPNPNHLRVSRGTWGDVETSGRWVYFYGEEDWWTSPAAVAATRAHIAYCNANGFGLTAVGFGWCRDMTRNTGQGTADPVHAVRWAGSSTGSPEGSRPWGLDAEDTALTGNSVSMDTYLEATQSLADYCRSNGFPTRVLFTTGPVDGWDNTREGGAQRELKHEYIRDYVRHSTDAILLDYADILCWSDAGDLETTSWTGWGRTHVYPVIHPDNMLDLDGTYAEDGDHIGERGTVRLAKAAWYLMARLTGWQPGGTPSNHPPQLGSIGAQTLLEGQTFQLQLSVTDEDSSQVHSYRMDPAAPAGASLDPNTGAFQWTPTEAQGPGTYSLTFTVQDNGTPSAEDSETVEIVVREVNAPPTLTVPESLQVYAGSTLTLTNIGVDADEPKNPLTFVLDDCPVGVEVHSTSGVLTWAVDPDFPAGTNRVTVRLTDDSPLAVNAASLSDVRAFEIVVRRFEAEIHLDAQSMSLECPALPGATYRIEGCPDLVSGEWTILADDLAPAGGLLSVPLPALTGDIHFFRVVRTD